MRDIGTALGALVGLVAFAAACQRPAPGPARPVVRPPDEVELGARVQVRAFVEGPMPGYHLLVWEGGAASDSALLVAQSSDRATLEALASLGARPSDDIPLEAWEGRADPGSAAPDRRTAGRPVEILLRLPGRDAAVPLAEVLIDASGRPLDLRFSGHAAHIERWRSGCIACLVSCPGAKLGNATYRVRDWTRGRVRHVVRPGALPPDGTSIGVVLRLRR